MAQFEATVVLVVVSLSLASVVYSGLKRGAGVEPLPTFVSSNTPLAGSLALEEVRVDSSVATTLTSLTIGSAASASGVLAFNGSGYSTTASLCVPGETTFFSLYASRAGTLRVTTDGMAWIAGAWGDAASVSQGWHEVVLQDGSACGFSLPGGESVPQVWQPSSSVLTSVPVEGSLTGTSFLLFLPVGAGVAPALLTASGGLYNFAV